MSKDLTKYFPYIQTTQQLDLKTTWLFVDIYKRCPLDEKSFSMKNKKIIM